MEQRWICRVRGFRVLHGLSWMRALMAGLALLTTLASWPVVAQSFAYDFIADAGTPIRDGRDGTVVIVRDDQTGNSFDDPDCGCMANALVIFHQDGSEGAYFHMPVNGVFKSVGAKVKRGDVIASVGNTGFSTTAHLHFQEQVPNSGGITTPSKFQGFTEPFPGSLIPMNCWVPEPGDKLFSNNDP